MAGNTQRFHGVCHLGPGSRLFESVLLCRATSDCNAQQARSDDRSSVTLPSSMRHHSTQPLDSKAEQEIGSLRQVGSKCRILSGRNINQPENRGWSTDRIRRCPARNSGHLASIALTGTIERVTLRNATLKKSLFIRYGSGHPRGLAAAIRLSAETLVSARLVREVRLRQMKSS